MPTMKAVPVIHRVRDRPEYPAVIFLLVPTGIFPLLTCINEVRAIPPAIIPLLHNRESKGSERLLEGFRLLERKVRQIGTQLALRHHAAAGKSQSPVTWTRGYERVIVRRYAIEESEAFDL